MSINENIIKNIANEIARNCQSKNVTVDPEFVTYMVDLLLYNPKYNKLFSKSVNRDKLEAFVNTCVTLLTSGIPSINTLKLQFIILTHYDTLPNLVTKHLGNIEVCLKPLVCEILDSYPEEEEAMKKLFRKISIYIILASGLGNPGIIMTLKEGMAALDSVFTLEDLQVFVRYSRSEKVNQLEELMQIVSGIRLFNRDCKKGGEGIHDMPFDLEDAAKACLISLSNSLMTVMQRVNSMTSAIDHVINIEDQTGNVFVEPATGVTIQDYDQLFSLLAFHRQYEVFIRRLLADTEAISHEAKVLVERLREVLQEIHAAVKYKAAVPVHTVYPLFIKLWTIWRAMQNEMYLISIVNNTSVLLQHQQDIVKIPPTILQCMLKDKSVQNDQQRVSSKLGLNAKMSLSSLKNFIPYSDSFSSFKDQSVQYLGFCALCLCKGALMPCNPRIGVMKVDKARYGFCTVKMATKFNREPQRYINEALDYIRNNPHLINLLNVTEEVHKVQYNEHLVVKVEPKVIFMEKEIQTELHPIPTKIVPHYNWNLWDHKKRACQWASIVNCKTHSTQTTHSHLRSEIQCQTVQTRDQELQTLRHEGTNVPTVSAFYWGLRGQIGDGQRLWNLTQDISDDGTKVKGKPFTVCRWPCLETNKKPTSNSAPSSTGGKK